MAGGNTGLNQAMAAKKNEFYTQLTDIEKEMRYYRQAFKDKVVFCNCDDPFESNFFKYFVLNFNRLKLKKLICTCYAGSPIANRQLSLFDVLDEKPGENANKPYKAIVTTVYDKTGDGSVDMFDIAELFKSGENELTELNGDGDFSSPECLALLDESDIVATNPPFSLFREYVAVLVEHKKQFIIIGNLNSVTYKEFFPLLKDNKVWFGASIHSGDRAFYVPDDYPLEAAGCGIEEETGRKYIRVKGVRWFTNLDIKQRHEELILVRYYNPDIYPKYINYDAIEVNRVSDIPCDYTGYMGVPINFMDVYNPDQFEIIGTSLELAGLMSSVAEKGTYMAGGKRFYTPCPDEKDIQRGYKYHRCYDRIVIRNRHPEPTKEKQYAD